MGEVLIKYKGVRVSQDYDTVLRGVDLELSRGSFVYLIGKVGAGKSSLLKTMYGELDITEGEAEVLGFTETDDLFLLWTKEKQVFSIAKQNLTGVDLAGFRALLQEKCPKAKCRWRKEV